MNKALVLAVFLLVSLTGCSKSNTPATSADKTTTTATTTATTTVTQVKQVTTESANDVTQKTQTLLAQAKKLLDSGKFNEAISAAQTVFVLDPKNMDAQHIIEMAKSKLAAMGQQKAEEVKGSLINKMGTFGK